MQRTRYTFTLSKRYIQSLIVDFEIGSNEQYNRTLHRPTWPGAASGVTVGKGYDLGYQSSGKIRQDWGGRIPAGVVEVLCMAAGVKGERAQQLLQRNRLLQQVSIPLAAADSVFYEVTLPEFCKRTARVYRGATTLHPIEQTAIVGLVYNRGEDVSNTDRRREMRGLIKAIVDDNDRQMADLVLSMRRLWRGQGMDGLLRRREAEAAAIALPDTIRLPESDLLKITVEA